MAELRERIQLAKEKLRVRLNPNLSSESFAEHGFKGGIRHGKEHPGCNIAQRLEKGRSNENPERRLRRLERKAFGREKE